MKVSAGLLLYRIKDSKPEIFLVHPGGPFYKNKEDGVWSFPKGEAKEGEDLLDVAKREFKEETGQEASGQFEYLGSASNSSKKSEIWMFEGDLDSANIKSNTTFIDWPPRSGKKMEISEVDRGEFFSIEESKKKISPYLVPIIEVFENTIK